MEKPQLFLLHFAGGNSYSFQFMAPYLKQFEVITPELPGRGKRMRESLLHDFDTAATDLYKQIKSKIINRKFSIYGHSMGAYLALRVCNLLERDGVYPERLIVSGSPSPDTELRVKMHLLGQKEFVERLMQLGGVQDELINDRELFGFFYPVLRADFEIAEKHGLSHEPPVKAPILALMGDLEDDNKWIHRWANYTLSDFSSSILEGDHFFIFKHPEKIARMIMAG